MEPLKLIYDGYEIEIRSCGESMPIVTMHKIQTNTIENDVPKLPKTIRGMDYQKTILDNSVYLVLFDPPYSITQASQLYKEYGKDKLEVSVNNMKYWKLCKDNIARILKTNGRVICCGWNTNGIGKTRGFEMTNILIVSHGGSKNDTLVTLEYKKEDVGI